MSSYRFSVALLFFAAVGLVPSETRAQVAFLDFEDFPRASTSANIGFESCTNRSPDVDALATSAQGDSTCTSGTGEFVSTASSSFSAVFTGTADNVAGASLSASVNAEADANPVNNLASKSSNGSGAVRMNFNALTPVRYRVSLSASVNSTVFAQSGADQATVTLANAGFAAFETITIEKNSGTEEQNVVREGILPAGQFFLRVNATGNANAAFAADAAIVSASLDVTFEPILSGGCCVDGSCSQRTREECTEAGGEYAGDNQPCVGCEVVVEECDLAWAQPQSGNFSDKTRWSPEAAPTDNGEGCNNLTFNQSGVFTVDLSSSRANSVAVNSGQVIMTGNGLNLAGRNTTALSVDASSFLQLKTATLNAPQVNIGTSSGSSASLGLEESSTMTTTGEVAVATGAGSGGLLGVSALTSPGTTLNVGSLDIGKVGEGDSFVIGLSTVSTTGDMTFGTQTGSKGTAVWTGPGEDTTPTLISVGESLVVGKLGIGDVVANGPFKLECINLVLGSGPASDGTLKILDPTSQAVVGSEFVVGKGGKGRLELGNGAQLVGLEGVIAQQTGSEATLSVGGATAQIGLLGGLIVGDVGNGTLEIKDTGLADIGTDVIFGKSTNGSGILNLEGASATSSMIGRGDIIFGQAGDGHLNIHGDALLDVKGNLRFGVGAGSEGSGFIGFGDDTEAACLVSVANTLSLGESGHVDITALGKAQILCDNLTSATGSGSVAALTLSGPSTELEVNHHLSVAGAGNATFTIEDENVISAETCTIGEGTGGLGAIRLKGGKSRLDVSQALIVSNETNGLLDLVEGGGFVNCASAVVGGKNLAAGGSVNLFDGSTFNAQTTISVGEDTGPALLRVEGGAVLGAGTSITVGAKGLFIARGNALIQCPLITGSGRIQIASSAFVFSKQAGETTGPVHFTGNLQLEEGGTLEVEAGLEKALQIDGTTTLGGRLVVLLTPDRTYEADEIIDLIDFAGGTTGEFSAVEFPNASEGFEGNVTFAEGALRLNVVRSGTGIQVGEGEGEGEGETPGGCNAGKSLVPIEKLFGDWITAFFGIAVLLGSFAVGRPHG